MQNSKPKIYLGTLIQFYEEKILPEYLKTLATATNNYDGELILDFCINLNQDLEKTNGDVEEIRKKGYDSS